MLKRTKTLMSPGNIEYIFAKLDSFQTKTQNAKRIVNKLLLVESSTLFAVTEHSMQQG